MTEKEEADRGAALTGAIREVSIRKGSGGARPGAGRKKGGKNTEPAQGRRDVRRMIALPPDVWEQLDRLAELTGITRTRLIKDALVNFLRYCTYRHS